MKLSEAEVLPIVVRRIVLSSELGGENLRVKIVWRSSLVLVLVAALYGVLYAQRPFREYPSVEYGESVPLPADYQQPGEWAFARLMYPPGPLDGYRGRFDGDWRKGLSLWTQDFPRADRAVRSGSSAAYTRVQARSRRAMRESGRWRRSLQLALALRRPGGRGGD